MPCDRIDVSLFDACTNISIRKGDVANFWMSRWLHGAAPAELAPSLFEISRLKRLTVSQAITDDKWMTGLHRINSADHLREFTGLWIVSRTFI